MSNETKQGPKDLTPPKMNQHKSQILSPRPTNKPDLKNKQKRQRIKYLTRAKVPQLCGSQPPQQFIFTVCDY